MTIRVMDPDLKYHYVGDNAWDAVKTFMEKAPGAKLSYEPDSRGGVIIVGGDPLGRVQMTIYGLTWTHFKMLRDRWRRQNVQ